MSRSRKGWRRVKFGEVVRLVTDRCDPVVARIERFVGLEHLEPGSLRVRSWGTVAGGTTFTSRFRPGHLLFGKRRAYQRKVAVADFEGVCSGDIYVLESRDPATLQPGLLPFLCQTDDFFEHAVGTSAGSLSPRTNWTRLAEYEFALPPMEDQQAILALLGRTTRVQEAFLAAEVAGRAMFRSALCSLYGVSAPRVSLAECAEISSGGTPDRGERSFWGGRIPWVKTGEVNYQDIMATDETITEEGLAKSAAKLLPPGTILMAMYGQGPTLGRVARLGIAAATNQACAAIQARDGVRGDFIYYWLIREYESVRRRAHGAAQPNLNLKIIKSLPIPRLSLDAQDSLIDSIRACEAACSALGTRRRRSAAVSNLLRATALGS